MTEQELDNLNIKQITKLAVDDLRDQSVIDRIVELAEDEQYVNEPMAAREFYEAVNQVLELLGSQIQSSEINNALDKIKIKMMWYALPALEKKLKLDILTKNLIFSLKNGMDIASQLESDLSLHEFGIGPDKQTRQMYIDSLVRNQEAIGTQSLKFKSGETVRNSISNWIKDYLSYSDPKNQSNQSYEMTQYLYSSPNVKVLNPNEKQLLASMISIYLMLKNPKYVPIIEKDDSVQSGSDIRSVSVPKSISEIKTASPEPTKEMTAFEKKLAQASTTSREENGAYGLSWGKGGDLEDLKHRVEESKTVKLTPPPAPKILTAPAAVKPVMNTKIAEEIKREISTKELPPHEEIKSATIKSVAKPVVASVPKVVLPVTPKPIPTPIPPKPVAPVTKPVIVPSVSKTFSKPTPPAKPVNWAATGKALVDINTVEDLKKIAVGHLRQGPLLAQVELIKQKIRDLAKLNKIPTYYAARLFEQSPLFKAYLSSGSSIMVSGSGTGELTQEEFEAMADLKRQVEQ